NRPGSNPEHFCSFFLMVAPMKKVFTGLITLAFWLGSPIQGGTVCVPPGILLPSSVTVAPGDTTNFTVVLGIAAPAGGVSLTLNSSDSSKATVSPVSLVIPVGVTVPQVPVIVSGLLSGVTTVTASAPGFTDASVLVMVTSAMSSPIILPSGSTVMIGS